MATRSELENEGDKYANEASSNSTAACNVYMAGRAKSQYINK